MITRAKISALALLLFSSLALAADGPPTATRGISMAPQTAHSCPLGKSCIYTKTNGTTYLVDAAGVEAQISTGAAGGGDYVTTTGTQTLTNKTLSGASNTISGLSQSSVTNLVSDLSAKASTTTTISAGTGLSGGGSLAANRTLSVDNTVVCTLSDSQTLINKTISGASNTISGVSQSSINNLTTDLAAKAALASPTFSGTVTLPHIATTGSTPSIAAGTGIGTGGSVSISGTDEAGVVTLNTGTSPASGSATFATITYASARSAAPRAILIWDASSTSAVLSGINRVFVDPANFTTTTWTFNKSTGSFSASATYKWFYFVIG